MTLGLLALWKRIAVIKLREVLVLADEGRLGYTCPKVGAGPTGDNIMQGHANLLGLWFKVENVGDVPATCAIMRSALDNFHLRFPDQQYIIIDQDADEPDPPIVVETVPGTTEIELWKWDGDEGYGGIYECSFPHGQGLRLDYGGSPANSAFSIYVVPLQISADGWVTATPVRRPRR